MCLLSRCKTWIKRISSPSSEPNVDLLRELRSGNRYPSLIYSQQIVTSTLWDDILDLANGTNWREFPVQQVIPNVLSGT